MKDKITRFFSYYDLNGFKINIAVLVLMLLSAAFLQSRAFMIGSIIAILFSLWHNHKIKLKTRAIFWLLPALLLVVFVLAFVFKTDSSLGRMLIYKISWNMFAENYLTGIGLGNFKIEYGLYQSKYFEQGNFTEKEFLLADNVFFAFNDYWQFIIETGVLGLVFICMGFYLVFKLIVLSLSSYVGNFSILTISCFIIVTVAALFTHVFEKPIFQWFIIVFLAWLLLFNHLIKLKLIYKSLTLAFLALLILFIANRHYLLNAKAYLKFNKAQELSAVGYRLESLKLNEEVYPVLKTDVFFLKSYGEQLRYDENQEKALQSYLKLIKHRTDYRIYLQLGKIYQNLGMNTDAEKSFLTAMYMVPNRFEARLVLFNFYLKINAMEKAKKIAEYTLHMPIKIPSHKIDLIIQELAEKIKTTH